VPSVAVPEVDKVTVISWLVAELIVAVRVMVVLEFSAMLDSDAESDTLPDAEGLLSSELPDVGEANV